MFFKLVFISIFITYTIGQDTKTNYQYNENDHAKVCTYTKNTKNIIKSILQ